MKTLEKISTKTIISIDVETVRLEEKYENLSEYIQTAWEYKQKNEGIIPDFERLAVLWEQQASFYAEFSKVCAVSLSFLDKTGEILLCKEFFGEDEKQILSELSEYLERIIQGSRDFRLAGHAAKYFDYPYLCKRFIINGLSLPSMLDTSHLRPWEGVNLDTNDLWKMGGTGAGSSLVALCVALGIPTSKDDLVGDEVGRVYFEGDYKRIGRYCSYDTVATFNVVRRMKGESIFQFEEVKFLGKEVEPQRTPLIQAIYNAGCISTDQIEQLLVTASELTIKERDEMIVIVKAALAKNVFTAEEEALFACLLAVKKQKKVAKK